MTFTLGTFCTGIASAEQAFAPLGAVAAYMAEIEPYPSAVLAYRHGATRPRRMPSPDDADTPKEAAERRAKIKALDRVPYWGERIVNFGDMTQIDPEELPFVDLLVAGCPCQAFSIAGLRKSLQDARGNLTLYFVKLVHELVRLGRIRSVLYENVPDLLNTEDNAFGAFLGALVGHDSPLVSPLKGGRWTNAGVADGPLGSAAWRVEDGQFSGVAQRRERVFLVASFGDGPDPVEVLFERQSLSGNSPPSREAGEGSSHDVAPSLTASGRGVERTGESRGQDPVVAVGPLRAAGRGSSVSLPAVRQDVHRSDGNGDRNVGASGVPALRRRGAVGTHHAAVDVAPTLLAQGNRAGGNRPPGTTVDTCESLIPVAYSIMPQNSGKDYKAREVDVAQPLMAAGPVGGNQGGDYIVQATAIRTNQTGANGANVSEDLAYPHLANESPQAVAFSLRGREGGAQAEVEEGGVAPALRAAEGGSTRPFVAFQTRGSNLDLGQEVAGTLAGNADRASGGAPCIASVTGEITHTLTAEGFDASEDGTGRGPPLAADGMAVRRITCVEAERLMGFEDNYTLIPWPTANRKGEDLEQTVAYLIGHGYSPEDAALFAQTPDGPRYKALGNSKIVPHVRKIGAAYKTALERYLAARAAA